METKNKNIAIYTCITGDYESPTDGFQKKDGYDYYLFCDKIIPVNSWSLLIPQFSNDENLTPVKKQRMIKTHPFIVMKDYDIVVWIDANTTIDDKLYKYIQANKNNPITFKQHPDRDCIYDEIKECVLWEKETINHGQFLYNRYYSEKYPYHNGLFETNIIISHPHDSEVMRLFNKWWFEIYNYSHRDQLSLNYVIWKFGFNKIITSVKCDDFPPKFHTKQ